MLGSSFKMLSINVAEKESEYLKLMRFYLSFYDDGCLFT